MDAPNGESLGDYTLKEPKLKNIKIDELGTRRIRDKVRKTNKIKITINIDQDLIEQLRGKAVKSGVPYQTLLNRLLRDAIGKVKTSDSRIDHLEREIASIKKKLSA